MPPGEIRAIPVITIEGHGGFENNLEGHPEHYAIDGQFGVVLEWGLPNEGSFAIEAALGPALVWGEAEHFYGRVHVESGDHDAHEGSDDHEGHDDHDLQGDHAEAQDDHEDLQEGHDDGHEGHGDHAGHAGHGHGSGARSVVPTSRAILKLVINPTNA